MQNIHIEFKINTLSGRPETWLNGKNVEQEIRSMQVSNLVSPVSALKFVRTAMTAQQQALGKTKEQFRMGATLEQLSFLMPN